MTKNRARRAIVTALAAALALSAAGCSGPPPSGASPAPTRIPVPELTTTGDLRIDCARLKTVLDGWTLDPTLSPGPGTPAEAAARIGGTGCVFADGDDHLLIGIAHLDDASVSQLTDYFTVNGLTRTSSLHGTAYFDPLTGDAEIFEDGTWISVVSSSFDAADAAAPVLTAVEGLIAAES